MRILRLLCVIILVVIFYCPPFPVFSEPSGNSSVSFTRLSVNEVGESIFIDQSIPLNTWPTGLVMTSFEQPSETVRFFKAEAGWEMMELHHAPKKQYLFVLQGVLEIQTSLGEAKSFSIGDILLVEDTYGKGHRTRNGGNGDLLLAWVTVEEDPQ